MADKSVGVASGGLEGLFRRPKVNYEHKEGETVTVTPRSTDLIYIRSCSQCKFRVCGKSAKCIIESSRDVKVEFEEAIMSGTLELITSKDITISINPQDALPTVSTEDCEGIHLHYYEPRAIGGIYTVKSKNIVVHLQPPHQPEQVLDLPEDNLGQYVSMLRGGKMATVQAIREGAGYLTTAEKQAMDEKREKELLRRLEEHLIGMLKFGKKEGAQSKPVEKQQAVQKEPKVAEKKSAATTQLAAQKTSEKVEGGGDEEAEDEEAEDEGDANPLAAAIRAKKKGLKQTETVERHLPVVGTGGRGGPAIQDDEEKREFFDDAEQLRKKVDRAVEWVRQSKHAIVFTGAGVSTSSGIPDFRSGMNTVLPTGPGVWELQAHGAGTPQGAKTVPFLKALPSSTHMAIVRLHEAGLVKFTISQNVDGIHRRSGLGPSQLAELHGNTNLETCQKCHRQYLRDFETRESMHVHDHRTSRQCDDPACRGILEDSIINFGEMLPQTELTNAFNHAQKADLCIVLGSSLRVRPACQVPEVVEAAQGRVIICNLQRIPQFPQDNRTMQVFCKCDEFMAALIEKLGLETPPFLLKRRARISAEKKEETCELSVTGLDVDEDVPYSFIKSVTVRHLQEEQTASSEPLSFTLPLDADHVDLTLQFHGHYREPPLQLPFLTSEGSKVVHMSFDIRKGTWLVQ